MTDRPKPVQAEASPTKETDPAAFGTFRPEPPHYQGMTNISEPVAMPDGVRLAVEVWLPRGLTAGTRLPTLLVQTRYWRANELRPPFCWFMTADDLDPRTRRFKPFFTGRGYALVYVDVRGTGASFGCWPYPWARDSIDDAAAIVDWIVAQPWSNGRVGGYGVSYLGTTAELLQVVHHPAVKAVMPMFSHPDAYLDIAFPGGLYNERFISQWGRMDRLLDQNRVPAEFGFLGQLLVRGVMPVAGENGRRLLEAAVRDHAANGDVHRLAQQVTYRDDRTGALPVCVDDLAVHRFREAIQGSEAAVYGWGSWLDAGTADAVLRRFLSFPQAGRAVIGAWDHGGLSHASPYQPDGAPVDPSPPAQWAEMVRFFDAYLKEADNGVRDERVLHYYLLGAERWRRTDVWPPAGTATQRWYLRQGQALLPEPPTGEAGQDQYTVDWEASTGDQNRWWEMGAVMRQTVRYPNRAAAGQRLLTYTTPPLERDIEIAGYPVVTLYLSSTEPDGELLVYLEEVDEAGRVTYLTEGQLRLIHRRVSQGLAPYRLQVPYHSFTLADAEPLVPGEVVEVSFGLLPTAAWVRQGHRLRLGIAGHDQGTFARIPAEGTPVLTFARTSLHASRLDLPVIAGS